MDTYRGKTQGFHIIKPRQRHRQLPGNGMAYIISWWAYIGLYTTGKYR